MIEGFVLLYPDKNIKVCCAKYNFSSYHFMEAILNFMFYKKPTRMRAPHPPDITMGEPAKHKQNKKITISQNILSRSFTAISGSFCLYLHYYRLYNLFSKNKCQNLLSHTWKHKNRHIIYVSSVCSCKIIRKNIYYYIRWRLSWILPFWTIFSTYKKMQYLFSLIFKIF